MMRPITVLIYTYNRPARIRRVLKSLQKHLHYAGDLLWRLADDGTPGDYLADIATDFPELNLEWSVTDRKGFGANANKGHRACTTHYVFSIEDDLPLIRDVDLDMGIRLMEGAPTVGALRYGITLLDTVLVGHVLKDAAGLLPYYTFDRSRSKYWNFCGHPTLIQPSWFGVYGRLPEGVRVARVELAWTRRVAKMDGPEVAVLAQYATGYYHFGHDGFPRLGGTDDDAGLMIELGKKPR